jgi:hypothetical protein
MIKIIALLFSICFFTTVKSQTTTDIETDRPDQTETPFSVGKNMFQAENGFSIAKFKNDMLYQNAVSLLRFGVSEKFELRAEIAHDVFNKESIGFNAKGIAPIEIGIKANLLNEKGWRPKTSIITHLALPKVASNNFKGNYYAPSFRFTMQHSLSTKQSLSYNIGGEWGTDDGEFTPLYTLATGYDFSKLVYGYVELYGFLPKNEIADHNLAGGFAFLVKPNVQFDISGGIGLTKTAIKNYWAMGLSFRLPK